MFINSNLTHLANRVSKFIINGSGTRIGHKWIGYSRVTGIFIIPN